MSRLHAGWLAECRERWSARPRAAPGRDGWAFPAPRSDTLWASGTVGWGWVLLAPGAVWSPAPAPAPYAAPEAPSFAGRVLYSDDAVLRRDPRQFHELSDRIWRFREAAHAPGHARALREWALRTAGAEPPALVPRDFTTGRVVWLADLDLRRDQLPGARLADPLVPIVRGDTPDFPLVCLLPARFWPETLAARWTAPP